jgi:hypothetical protein
VVAATATQQQERPLKKQEKRILALLGLPTRVMLGPLLAGVAVSVLKGPLSSTHGYAGMWLVCGASVLASIPFVGHIREDG